MISSLLVVLGTIILAYNTSLQSQKNEEESNLIFQVSNVGVAYANYAANTSNVLLYTTVVSECNSNSSSTPVTSDACNSNKILLENVSKQHDPLKTNSDTWTDITMASLKKYNESVSILNAKIQLSEDIGFLLLSVAVVMLVL